MRRLLTETTYWAVRLIKRLTLISSLCYNRVKITHHKMSNPELLSLYLLFSLKQRSKVLRLKLPLETNKSCPFPTSRSQICCSKKKENEDTQLWRTLLKKKEQGLKPTTQFFHWYVIFQPYCKPFYSKNIMFC